MNKYINKYRVLIERDIDGEPMEFTYLRGVNYNSGGYTYRYSDDILTTYFPYGTKKMNNVIKKFKELDVEVTKTDSYDDGFDIYFYEKDIDVVKDIIGLTDIGAKIVPHSIKNHPRKEEIKKERWDALSEEEKQARIDKGKRLQEVLLNSRLE